MPLLKYNSNAVGDTMNSHDLVHGAILAQQNSGGDLVDTLNTSSFQHLPLKAKVDFINTYANTKGAPDPVGYSAMDRIKHIAASGVSGLAAGALVGAAMHVAKGGKLLSPHIHSPKNMTSLTKEQEALADKELAELWGKVGGAGQIGGAVGALKGWSTTHDENRDAAKIRESLDKIRSGQPHVGTALAINSDYLHGRRESARSNAGFADVQKIVKDNLIF